MKVYLLWMSHGLSLDYMRVLLKIYKNKSDAETEAEKKNELINSFHIGKIYYIIDLYYSVEEMELIE